MVIVVVIMYLCMAWRWHVGKHSHVLEKHPDFRSRCGRMPVLGFETL